MILKNKTTWVVVADGSRARIYTWEGGPQTPLLVQELESSMARIHSHDLGSTKPHGIFELNQPQSKVDLHKKEEERFSQEIAALLNRGVEDHVIHSIILIAPPKFLSFLRQGIDKNTSQCLVKEIHKDLTHMHEHHLKEYLWGSFENRT
jgi:protein required for attachment to host cells